MNWVLCFGVVFAVVFGSSEGSQIRCKFPGHPKNGYLRGDWINRSEGETLRVECYEGFKLKGPSEAVCKNGEWTTALGKCEVVMCQPPKTGRLSISDPPSCLTGSSPYGTLCRMSCPPGYPDQAGLFCSKDGQWEGRDVVCKDRQPPDLKCPSKDQVITHQSDPGKATAKVSFPTPSYTDNSEAHGGKLSFSATLDGKPVSVKKEHELSITPRRFDYHEVKYIVTDEAGNEAKCYFLYRIQDKEAPKITSCPSNIALTTKKGENMIRVSWKEPTVTDNSGKDVSVFCDRVNYSQFPVGTHLVRYHVSDRSNNKAFCEFHITVKLPCIDHPDFPITSVNPGIVLPDPANACSYPASDLTKYLQKNMQSLLKGYPSTTEKIS
ncbi:Hypothetical predicted protein [Paramuricea clavata]|uniref:Uncharacterized protein n=1 Tax=Paramuricea clavata TaxID=317549 RepID=A0A7D9DUR0_PARCT|nr:Hypothetical predicted protein [Paramuricea clavata]